MDSAAEYMPVDAWWQMIGTNNTSDPPHASAQNPPALAAARQSQAPIASPPNTGSCQSCSLGPTVTTGTSQVLQTPALQHLFNVFAVGALIGSVVYLGAIFYKVLSMALPPPEAGQSFATILTRLVTGVVVVAIIAASFASLPNSLCTASMYPLGHW